MVKREFKLSVEVTKMPESVRGFCMEGQKDDYTMVINSGMSEREQITTFLHEMLHIWHGDHDGGRSLEDLERTRTAEMVMVDPRTIRE